MENLIQLRISEYDRLVLLPARNLQTQQLNILQSTINKIYGNGSGNDGMLETMRKEIGSVSEKVDKLLRKEDKQLGAHYERERIRGIAMWIASGVATLTGLLIVELVKTFLLKVHP